MGIYVGGGVYGECGGGGTFYSISHINLTLMFKQVMKYCENVRFANFIRICQRSFCLVYFRIFQRKCDSA